MQSPPKKIKNFCSFIDYSILLKPETKYYKMTAPIK